MDLDEVGRLLKQFSLLPIKTAWSSPDTKEFTYNWKPYQSKRMTDTNAFEGAWGCACVCGRISGGLWVIDFDDIRYEDCKSLLELEFGSEFIQSLCVVKTGGGGTHLYFQCAQDVPGNEKLAMTYDAFDKLVTGIETRGEGGLIFCPWTPGYSFIQGDWRHIPVILRSKIDDIRSLLKTLDETPVIQPADPLPRNASDGERPGDIYNSQVSFRSLLESQNWRFRYRHGIRDYYTRPGKVKGTSATVVQGDSHEVLYVFTSNAHPLEPGHSYSPFAFRVFTQYGGDFKKGTKEIARELGLPMTTPAISVDRNTVAVIDQETGEVVEATKQNPTDLGNAYRLIEAHGQNLRYCHKMGAWLVWSGEVWQRDETGGSMIQQCAENVVRSLHREAEAIQDDEKRKAAFKFAFQCENSNRIKNMIDLARGLKGVPVDPDDLDKDDWLLTVGNGTLDLRTSKLKPFSASDMITRRSYVPYHEDATAPVFRKFLDDTFGDPSLIKFVVRSLGVTLTGDTREQKFWFAYGSGANGKSTLLDAALEIMGDYGDVLPMNSLQVKLGEAIPSDLAGLKGARLVIVPETEEGKRVDESLLKRLTGGDVIKVRYLHKDWFKYKPNFKLWIYGNHKPHVRNFDEAFARRLLYIPFNNTVPESEQDKTLPYKLRQEYPGILTYLVAGCQQWQERGLMPTPEALESAAEYRRELDVMGRFIEERCHVGVGQSCSSSELYRAYVEWCKDNNEYCLSAHRFTPQMRERGFEWARTNQGKTWRGVGL